MEVLEHRKNGLLVDFFSTEQIADAVVEALDQPQNMQLLRQNARQRVIDHYDLHSVCLPQQLRLIGQASMR
ncbi:hypothetical protein [Noviherbaspirillum sedimenti]|uniref:hypothetical protein n=1 Tax=Noviherbaspirillum sedimenti TaxID=2320865 RepID=UPI001F2A02CD|nr:hypothetical protein [Noviherbaspirillum sedimenti]